MALDNKHSISTFIAKILWILLLVLHEFNLVICDDLEDDSLKKALEAIELRQRDLEFPDNEYYGQKTLGFFDSNGAAENLGSFDSDPKNENELRNILFNYQRARDYEKRKSNFRERLSNSRKNYLISDRDESGNYGQNNIEYLQMLKNLWSKYQESQNPYLDLEDLTDEQVEEILNSFDDWDANEQFSNNYGNSESNSFEPYEAIGNRRKKNYRVFERLNHNKKRYSSLGEKIPAKRNFYSELMNYENPENDFLNSFKYMNSELSRDALDNSAEDGLEVFEDDKGKDLVRFANNPNGRPNYFEDDDPNWLKNQNNYNEEVWLQKPVMLSNNRYENGATSDKRMEIAPRFFKNHNGINLNLKRYPVKRSSVRIRKEAKNEEVSKELKEIFEGPSSTTSSPSVEKKEKKEKKPTEIVKKQNVTKPIVTKHREAKKVVRRDNHNTKEQVVPVHQNEEIDKLFSGSKKSVNKKSIDWSQYFGIDKRNPDNWLNRDYLMRSESHFLMPKEKRNRLGMSRGNFYEPQQHFQVPFDTRRFSKKNYPSDLGNNIEKVENKIGDIEEKIIANAIKYTGAHTGDDGEDMNRVKNRVIQHLEAAYSLEKMKNAFEEFKNFMSPENKRVNEEAKKKSDTKALQKVEESTTESQNLETIFLDKKSDKEPTKEVAAKKGAKNSYEQQTGEYVEYLNDDDSYPRRFYNTEECPVLDEVHRNCLQIEEAGGKYADLLTPLCSLQQLCYFCGSEIGFSKLSMCDSLYLSEAQNICQDNKECLIKARNSLMALKDLHDQDLANGKGLILFSGSCLSNVCVQRYFLNSPSAIYSLEVQK